MTKRSHNFTARDIAYPAAFCALLLGGQYVFSFVEGVEIVTALLVCFCAVFGVRQGVICAAAFSLLRCLIFGFYPTVVIVYFIYYPAFACTFGLLGHIGKEAFGKSAPLAPAVRLVVFTGVAAVCTLCFTLLDDIVTPVFYGYSKTAMLAYFYASFTAMLPQTVCAAVTVGLMFLPVTAALESVKKRRGWSIIKAKEKTMYDCAVIGSGAAGVSAALTLKALNVNFMLFGTKALSSKIRSAEKIQNYPGLPAVSGEEMSRAFSEQLSLAGISVTEKTVTGIYPAGNAFTILCGNELFEAKSVILATGVESVKPIKGELEFLGRGVSYCATCDGALYKNKKIAVLCTQKELEHEAEFLASLAEKVYYIPLYKEAEVQAENVERVSGMPLEIKGGGRAEKLVFRDSELAIDGVFLLKASAPPAALLQGLETESGHIAVNRSAETNLEGVFAAGDCTGRPYQYAKAAGEGNVAAHAVYAYLKN